MCPCFQSVVSGMTSMYLMGTLIVHNHIQKHFIQVMQETTNCIVSEQLFSTARNAFLCFIVYLILSICIAFSLIHTQIKWFWIKHYISFRHCTRINYRRKASQFKFSDFTIHKQYMAMFSNYYHCINNHKREMTSVLEMYRI